MIVEVQCESYLRHPGLPSARHMISHGLLQYIGSFLLNITGLIQWAIPFNENTPLGPVEEECGLFDTRDIINGLN